MHRFGSIAVVSFISALTAAVPSIAAPHGGVARYPADPVVARTLTPPPFGQQINVAVVLTEGATMIDFAGPWEVFQDVTRTDSAGVKGGDSRGFRLYTVSETRAPIHVEGGMAVIPDYTFADAPVPQVVVVGAQLGSPGLSGWLRKMDTRVDVIMSVCVGAFHLANAGLLDGKPATTHHDFYASFEKNYPKVDVKKGLRFIQSDSIISTAGGLTSGIDMALHVVDRYFGHAMAARTAEYMEYDSKGWEVGR